MRYEAALENAWRELVEWVADGRFVPENEESIQCFLYRGIVNHLGSAVGVRAKPTTDKPRELFKEGKLDVENMHFPDFILGNPKEVVVEIKYARGKKSLLASCKKDIQKMLKHHGVAEIRRVFILFDENPDYAFLSEKRKRALQSIDPMCLIKHC